MTYSGRMQDFVLWFFSPSVGDGDKLRQALTTVPRGRAWELFCALARGMTADELRAISNWMQVDGGNIDVLKRVDFEAELLETKARLVTEENQYRSRELQGRLAA